MAQFPSLPLWTDAYLGDTTHLTTLEHGAYLLLLIVAWRSPKCRLPNDDKMLARYAKLTPGQWQRIKPVVMEFFDIEGEFILQGRLTDEHNRVKRNSTRQSDRSKARWLKKKETPDTVGEPDECRGDAPITITTPTKKDKKNGYRFHEDFYPQYPNKKGKDAAEKAYKKLIDKGVPHEEIMEGLKRFVADIKIKNTEQKFIAHPATWLNQGRWQDEYDTKPRRTRG